MRVLLVARKGTAEWCCELFRSSWLPDGINGIGIGHKLNCTRSKGVFTVNCVLFYLSKERVSPYSCRSGNWQVGIAIGRNRGAHPTDRVAHAPDGAPFAPSGLPTQGDRSILPRKRYYSLGRRKGRASNAPAPPDTLPPSAPIGGLTPSSART